MEDQRLAAVNSAARVRAREVGGDYLGLLADCLSTEPEVPKGKQFKRFPRMIVCGRGELIRTSLQVEQAAVGEELK